MDKKQIGIIMQAIAGIVSVGALITLIKWHPIHVGVLVLSAIIGYVGNRLYR